jgi:acyl-CoA synthetase (AMP-forming)/AMP-acid ligase II
MHTSTSVSDISQEFVSENAPTAARDILPSHCCHVFHSRASAGGTQNLNRRSRFALEIQEVPSLLDAYPNLGAETENCPLQPYPTKVSTTSLDDIALYIRSSGSTGLPRAVGETHQMLKQWIILCKPIYLTVHISEILSTLSPSRRCAGRG